MKEYKIALVKGDGIGPEIINESVKVLNKISKKYNFKILYENVCLGGEAIDKFGAALPDETITRCKNCDAILLGAVGGPKWDSLTGVNRPESALLGLRKGLNLFANLRPVVAYESLLSVSPLKKEVIGSDLDIMIVRELTGGIYFGDHSTIDVEGKTVSFDIERYSSNEIERVVRLAFELSKKRNKKICSVDKANVLDTSRLWRKIVEKVSREYQDVKLVNMYVDNCAMQLIRDPKQFDVIVTSNMFGDILSDEASMISGSIGLLPSASLGESKIGLYEPIHGSAPDIAGFNIANPIASILSVSMMLKYSFNEDEASDNIVNAVKSTLNNYCTRDIKTENKKEISCSRMGTLICSNI